MAAEPNPLKLRGAQRRDVPALLAFEESVFGDGPYAEHLFTAAQFLYYLRNPNAMTWVAERGGAIVGSVLGIFGTGRRAHHAEIHSLGVVRAARRQGVGRMLMDRFLNEAKRRGCRQVGLHVAHKNRAAKRLFDEYGFEVVDWLPLYYGAKQSAFRMRLEFSEG